MVALLIFIFTLVLAFVVGAGIFVALGGGKDDKTLEDKYETYNGNQYSNGTTSGNCQADLRQYYNTLETEIGASKDEVRQAYREMVKVWHPDRFEHDSILKTKAEIKMKLINEAYQVLNTNVTIDTSGSGSDTTLSSTSQDDAMLIFLRKGGKIDAIKLRRANTQEGLAEAKKYVDHLAYKHGLGPKPT